MKTRISTIEVNSFNYMFLDGDEIIICDKNCSQDYYTAGSFVRMFYVSDCPDCEDDPEMFPIGIYKIKSVTAIKYSELNASLSSFSKDNVTTVMEDLHMRFGNIKDDEMIYCIIVKNRK